MMGIYKITNNLNGKIYIGQSIDIARRWEDHLMRRSGCNSLIGKAIKKYGQGAFSFEVIEECLQDELDELEQYWIEYYDSYNKGYNQTIGGQGTAKYKTADILSTVQKTQNLAQAARECNCSIGVVRRIAHDNGISFHEQSDAKPVEAIDPQTLQVVKRYTSIRDAASSLGVVPGAITKVLQGEHQTSCGYYWRLVGDEKQIEVSKPKMWKTSVCKVDPKTGEIIATYESASAAAEAMGKDRKNGGSQITAVCNGRRKSAMGFIWCYESNKDNIQIAPTKIKEWKSAIEQVNTETGEVIATYESASAAAKALGVVPSSIARVVRGERKTAYGYMWRKVSI